jgi:2-amino-4-hydroxy-6-hydroxymethyldihydropteridine diphosphokinase
MMSVHAPVIAHIALGANLGEPSRQLRQALGLIATLPQTQLQACAAFYASAPVGYTEQPDFLNTVCRVSTQFSAEELLEALLSIESALGRQRSFANAPRTIDLDLILYGTATLDTPHLTVPHPRLHERAFVLVPLLEISPDIEIPHLGPATQFLPLVAEQRLQKLRASQL